MNHQTTWTPPGPGRWEWQGSHVPGVPTPLYTDLYLQTFSTSMAKMFKRYGVPMRTLEVQLVNRRLYVTLQPLVGKAGAKAPPKPILWLATRAHPEFRRRAKAAAHALGTCIWRARTQEWRDGIRPRLRAANLALQAEKLDLMTNDALADHLQRAYGNAQAGYLLHFDLHGDDLGPLGLFLFRCREWGIEPGQAIAALAGYSPSTRAPIDELARIASLLGTATPASLQELRLVSPEISTALDCYLNEYGWRLVTGYDIDAKTVGELPQVLLANILSSRTSRPARTNGDEAAAELRSRITTTHASEFDALLEEARVALDLRDDNGPITAEWTVGLVRRAVLEIGRRLAGAGALYEAHDAVELSRDELLAALAGQQICSAEEISTRAAERATAGLEIPPQFIGSEAPPPDLSVFPTALATTTAMAMTATALLERAAPSSARGDTADDGVIARGLGVGRQPWTGRVRTAASPDEALEAVEPGDVLVVQFTTPAFNSVLAVCGAVVTAEGGALAHAAVLARELGIAGLIGVGQSISSIPDGATVELDPVAGTLRLVH